MSVETKQLQLVRSAKRLVEAAGYMELGMIQHTLDRLDTLPGRGYFEAEIKILRGEALRQQDCYADAVAALKLATRRTSSPHSKAAWLALSLHGQTIGADGRAAPSLTNTRRASK